VYPYIISVKRKRSKKKKTNTLEKQNNMLTKEEAYSKFELGWYSLLDIAYETINLLPFYCPIESMGRRFGMLSIKFHRHADIGTTEEFILKSVEHKLERASANVCETCGQFGRRRTDLQSQQTLCTTHYALQYSEEHPAPSLMANPEPHTDY
jgi:hypothetical protein